MPTTLIPLAACVCPYVARPGLLVSGKPSHHQAYGCSHELVFPYHSLSLGCRDIVDLQRQRAVPRNSSVGYSTFVPYQTICSSLFKKVEECYVAGASSFKALFRSLIASLVMLHRLRRRLPYGPSLSSRCRLSSSVAFSLII